MRIGSISGSLQRLVNDTSYLVAGTNVTIASGSNGQVTISSAGGGGGGGGGYEQAFNSSDLAAGILSVTHGLPDDYVHVSVYDDTDHQVIPNEVIITGTGTLDIDLSSFSIPASPDWHVFITSANASVAGTPASPNRSVQFNNAGAFGGSANFTYDGKLSVTGSFAQFNASGDTVGFMGDQSSTTPSTLGTDVFFYVSGSKSSKDGPSPTVALFGGDVVISGTLHGGSPLKIGSDTQITGSLWQKNNGSNTIGFMGDDSGVPASKGTDVFFYASGTIGSKDGATSGVALFGGDVVISGSTFIDGNQLEITGTLSVTQGISGSLTQLTDGTSYIIAGANTTVVSQSNGSITISSIPSSPTDSVQYNSSGIFAGSSNFTYNGTQVFVGGTLRVGNSAVANGTNSIASGEGSALGAYTVAHGKITEARGENSFAHGQGTVTYANATHAEGLQTHASEQGSHAEGWLTVSSGSYSHAEGIGTIASGSGQHVEGKYNVRGNDHSLLVIGNGTDTMDSTRSDVIRVEMDGLQLSGSLWQTNSGSSTVGFMGNDTGSPQTFGSDVFFYVSGSKSSKDGPIPTVALFGGDVVISGTLHGGSPLKVGSGLVITGSLITTQYYAGEVESVTATGAISTTKHTTKFSSTTGAYSLTLADGNTEGQLKYLVCGSITGGAGGTIDVTPDTIFGDWTYLAFSSYDSATLMWVGNGWAIVNVYGANPSFPS